MEQLPADLSDGEVSGLDRASITYTGSQMHVDQVGHTLFLEEGAAQTA
jgi:hypothetical protein